MFQVRRIPRHKTDRLLSDRKCQISPLSFPPSLLQSGAKFPDRKKGRIGKDEVECSYTVFLGKAVANLFKFSLTASRLIPHGPYITFLLLNTKVNWSVHAAGNEVDFFYSPSPLFPFHTFFVMDFIKTLKRRPQKE